METETKELNEEEIQAKHRQLEELSIQSEGLGLQIEQLQKAIDLKLPERKARADLLDLIARQKLTDKNRKVIEKQIRERKEMILK